ncbi:MAG: hypothetical protein Q8K63_02375 [Acidimicrobiales bacterium]|nr:hypothetical protein [Acidimicrobiales bacterium]
MTIKKGEPWGSPAAPPDDAVRVDNDRAISLSLDEARKEGRPFPRFAITGGDLGRTLAASDSPRNRFTIDVGEALVDGLHRYFISHVVARHRGWRDAAVVMNAQWLGTWNLGPKSHPNDGLLDVSEFSLNRFEWHKVRSRLESGTHLPHPRIETKRTAATSFEFARPATVFVDGAEVGTARTLAVRIIPDALTVYA